MKVIEIMTRTAEVVSGDTTLAEAAKRMRHLNIGALPVCDGMRLVGMLTDRDITTRATARGLDPKITHVKEAMTADIIYCFEDEAVETAARMMEERQIRRLPVLNREKRLAGILSIGDLAVRSGKTKLAAEVLEEVSKPAKEHKKLQRPAGVHQALPPP